MTRVSLHLASMLFLMSLGLSGCSFVNLTSQGEQVRVVTLYDVAGCERIGSTVVSVKDSVAGIDRSQAKIDAELAILARNSAPDIGGDTVVREARLTDGKQRFGIYKCHR